jgi:1-deoxy-D-xylulose 5-phosphate reductoisomerase
MAIVGAAGVTTTLEAAKRGETILLANKESLVIAGEIVMAAAKQHGATILTRRLRALKPLSPARCAAHTR